MCAYCAYTSRTLHFCCLDMGDLTSGTLGFKSAEGIGFQSFFQPIPHGTKLVGGLEHFLLFHILGIISSQLIFIFFRGVGQPPTSFCVWIGFRLVGFRNLRNASQKSSPFNHIINYEQWKLGLIVG